MLLGKKEMKRFKWQASYVQNPKDCKQTKREDQ